MNTESRLNLTVFILACVHVVVSALHCVKKMNVDSIIKLPKHVVKCLVDWKNWNKHAWCISLLVVVAIAILSGLNQWMTFDDEESQ